MTKRLEELIDRYDAECPEIRRFILPGGTQGWLFCMFAARYAAERSGGW